MPSSTTRSAIFVFDRETEALTEVDRGLHMLHGALAGFELSWSHDSRWIAWSRGLETNNSAVFLFDTEAGERFQVTSGYYNDFRPVFDPAGKHLYYYSNRTLAPVYSDLDATWVYPNATNIVAATLRDDVPSPLAPRNDEEPVAEDDDEAEPDTDTDEEAAGDEDEAGPGSDDGNDAGTAPLDIDVDGFESRAVILPVGAGSFGRLRAADGRVVFHRRPHAGGAGDQPSPIVAYDLEEREEQTILPDGDSYEISADGKKLLVSNERSWAIVDVAPGQTLEDRLATNALTMTLDPSAEWRQMFDEVWRTYRDYFYDDDLHGLDWNGLRAQYGGLIDQAVTRWDVNFLIGELIGEVNASHTYVGGGDTETPRRRGVGLLGVDWSLENGAYRIARIVRGAPWDIEDRSPLDEPGVDVDEGDYLLAVNGNPLDPARDPYSAFEGLAGETVLLTVNDRPTVDDAREVVVTTLGSEATLRMRDWIEQNRRRVDEASGGRIGYLYVPNTAVPGQTELVRQFHHQHAKDGLIIDERWNGGGQLPDRFVELDEPGDGRPHLLPARGDRAPADHHPSRPQGDVDQRPGRLGRRRVPVVLPRDGRRRPRGRAHLGRAHRPRLGTPAHRRRLLHGPARAALPERRAVVRGGPRGRAGHPGDGPPGRAGQRERPAARRRGRGAHAPDPGGSPGAPRATRRRAADRHRFRRRERGPLARGDGGAGRLECSARRPAYRSIAEQRRQMGVGARTYCDIVVKLAPSRRRILAIAGNVHGAVILQPLPAADGPHANLPPLPSRRRIFANLKLRAAPIRSPAISKCVSYSPRPLLPSIESVTPLTPSSDSATATHDLSSSAIANRVPVSTSSVTSSPSAPPTSNSRGTATAAATGLNSPPRISSATRSQSLPRTAPTSVSCTAPAIRCLARSRWSRAVGLSSKAHAARRRRSLAAFHDASTKSSSTSEKKRRLPAATARRPSSAAIPATSSGATGENPSPVHGTPSATGNTTSSTVQTSVTGTPTTLRSTRVDALTACSQPAAGTPTIHRCPRIELGHNTSSGRSCRNTPSILANTPSKACLSSRIRATAERPITSSILAANSLGGALILWMIPTS